MIGEDIDTLIAPKEKEIDFFEDQINQQYNKNLRRFIEDDSYFENYDNYIFHGNEVLVKLFEFEPSADLSKKQLLGERVLLLPIKDPKTGKIVDWKPGKAGLERRIYPLVKVIKVGLRVNFVETAEGHLKEIDEKYRIKEGSLYTVPADDVVGENWNPDFLFNMNSFAKTNQNGKPSIVNTPEDMPQKLPKVEINWAKYKFETVDKIKDKNEFIYLIPSLKLKARYK